MDLIVILKKIEIALLEVGGFPPGPKLSIKPGSGFFECGFAILTVELFSYSQSRSSKHIILIIAICSSLQKNVSIDTCIRNYSTDAFLNSFISFLYLSSTPPPSLLSYLLSQYVLI